VVVHQFTRAKNIYAENRELREEVTKLNTRLSLLEEDAAENKRLTQLLEFQEDVDEHALLPARVIAREPSVLYRSLIINQGTTARIGRDMPVVNNDGLVGKVVQALPHISLVQLLKDPSARTSVMTKRTRVVGILETENGRDFFVQYRVHAEVDTGDTVMTSGLGGIYPRGLFVGAVTKVRERSDPLFKRVYVEPFVDFEHLEEVSIIQRTAQWAAISRELDSLDLTQ
jgi:rod shape-determining protein MreC